MQAHFYDSNLWDLSQKTPRAELLVKHGCGTALNYQGTAELYSQLPPKTKLALYDIEQQCAQEPISSSAQCRINDTKLYNVWEWGEQLTLLKLLHWLQCSMFVNLTKDDSGAVLSIAALLSPLTYHQSSQPSKKHVLPINAGNTSLLDFSFYRLL